MSTPIERNPGAGGPAEEMLFVPDSAGWSHHPLIRKVRVPSHDILYKMSRDKP